MAMPMTQSGIEIKNEADENFLEVHVSGKLTKKDYEKFVPEIERWIKDHGKLRLLFDMRDFHGWTVAALWEDTKFDLKHFRDIKKLAMIGEKKWQQWMSTFCKPFTSAEIRYFSHDDVEKARAWIVE